MLCVLPLDPQSYYVNLLLPSCRLYVRGEEGYCNPGSTADSRVEFKRINVGFRIVDRVSVHKLLEDKSLTYYHIFALDGCTYSIVCGNIYSDDRNHFLLSILYN